MQAAINAAGNLLPVDLPAPPIYAKVNPADAPILTLALTSKTDAADRGRELAEQQLGQKISQIGGVGLVTIAGGQRPAVRIQVNTRALASYGLTLETLRTAIGAANANGAKGSFDGPTRAYAINANDQLLTADRLRQPDHRLQERRAGPAEGRRPRSSRRRRTPSSAPLRRGGHQEPPAA